MTGSDELSCPKCHAGLRKSSLFCPDCGTAVMPGIDNALRMTINQLLGALKPGQAEVMRRCAIPRWFDAPILGVLRDRDDGNNELILAEIVEYSFVRRLSDGRYSYNEDVRSLLLGDWQARPNDLRVIQKRLYSYCETQASGALPEHQSMWQREVVMYDLLLASSTVVSETSISALDSFAPPLLLKSTLDARVDRALVKFRAQFEAAESSFRLAEAESLVVAAEEQSELLVGTIRDWLVYYRARLDYFALQYESSIGHFRRLLRRPNVDPELKILGATSLGDVLVETGSWTQAIDSYRQALEEPGLNERQEAEIRIGLADAYNEIAISAGGWHLTPYQPNLFLRWVEKIAQLVTYVPIFILVTILRRLGAAVPPPTVVMRYQNWLLARMFRASREETEAAFKIYSAKEDDYNMARCEMRLIEVDVLFGNIKPSVPRAWALYERPFASNPYRKARVQLSMSRVLLADGQHEAARTEINKALVVFRSLGDGRWETRALTQLGRIEQAAANPDAALAIFKQGLDRSREIGSMLSRERILYELRAWRRTSPNAPAAATELIDQEPIQRFVGRFPKILLSTLQIGQTLLIPGVLLLVAEVSPTPHRLPGEAEIMRTAGKLLLPAFEILHYPFVRMFTSALFVIVLAALGYAILGLIVLWRMPLVQLTRNQPDVIEVTPATIARYDSSGTEVQRLEWKDVNGVLTADRQLWRRALPLFSRSFVQVSGQPPLRIDGITGWYNNLNRLIAQRARAVGVDPQVVSYNRSLLRGLSGGVLLLGGFLLAMAIMSANLWISDIRHVLTPTVYAVVQPLGLSGILLIMPAVFWAVIEPLHLRHKVNLDDTLPAVVGIGGGFLVLAYVLTGGEPVSIPALNVSLLIVGAFFVSEAIQWLGQQQGAPIPYRGLRLSAQVLVMVVALFVATPSIKAMFYATRASAFSVRGDWVAAGNDRMREAIENTGPFSGRTPLEEAAASTQFREWATAEDLYARIIGDPEAGVQNRSLAIYNRIRSNLARDDFHFTPAQLTEMITALDALLIQPDQMDHNGLLIHALGNIPIARASVRETQADLSFLLGDAQGALGYLRQALAVAEEPLLIHQLNDRITNKR